MKKRILSAVLALGLLLTTPALATQDGTFSRIRTYTGQFSDLAADSTFYDNVSALYEYGLSVGKADGTFGPADSLTVGQAVIFAGRIRSLYRTGDPEAGPHAYGGDGGPVAAMYLRYLQAEGVLDHTLDDCLADTATRAQMAHVLANVLPEEILPPIHDSLVTQAYAARQAITDVTEYTPYYQDILALYRKGVCIGVDDTGSFLPDASITRGAAAAMLTRMVDPELRVTPPWGTAEDTHSAQETTLGDLVEPGTYIAAPATGDEMDESIRYMLANNSHQLTLNYPGISVVQARSVMEEAIAILKSYCEQGYNSVTCNFNAAGTIILNFSAVSLSDTQVAAYRTASMEAAIAVHDQLWADGTLTEDMTEAEIAQVYYTWICENCVYDYGATETSLSHLPYSLFENGTAVCDGYTGAYNMFLKLEGIDCYALSNDSHIWTVANLDGAEVHIDTTWGDSNPAAINYTYFAMTPEESWQQHSW